MADIQVSDLQPIERIYDNDYLLIQQDAIAKKVTGYQLSSFINRKVMNVSVTQIGVNEEPTTTFNRVTGDLGLFIPKANGIVSITSAVNERDEVISYTFYMDNGTRVTLSAASGPKGKSAYDYARENGYSGSESDYAQMAAAIGESAAMELERQQNETERESTFTYMQSEFDAKIELFEDLMEYMDSYVDEVTHTLVLFKGGVNDTTLYL